MRQPTPHQETRVLVQSLANAGWGPLSGGAHQGLRSTLQALVASLPYKSGAGFVTTNQVADRGGLSARWTRDCMQLLEALGLITWTRGGVQQGRPMPSHVRISKRALVELIRLARPALDAIQSARRAATNRRIAGLIRVYRTPRKRIPLSRHVELGADLRPLTGESPGDDSPVEQSPIERRATMRIPCDHETDARRCHRCVALDQPPTGWRFETDGACQECGHKRRTHDKQNDIAIYHGGVAHMFTPDLLRAAPHKVGA